MAGGQEKSAAPSYVITAGAFLPCVDRHRNKTQPEERKEGKGRLGTRWLLSSVALAGVRRSLPMLVEEHLTCVVMCLSAVLSLK